MNPQLLAPMLYLSLGVSVFMLIWVFWSVLTGSRQMEKIRRETMERYKPMMEESQQRQQSRFEDEMAVRREQLEVFRELLVKIRGLREELRRGD